ncbi:MAG: FAD/NAD(P)-binding oxidoreductase [Bacteroidota bacterium]
MKRLLILGAGTGGTIMANKMRNLLTRDEWEITIVDQDSTHYYQPGFLYIPFGMYTIKDVVKSKTRFLPSGVNVILQEIDRVDGNNNQVILKDGISLKYDFLIIATGTRVVPEETPGLKGPLWHKNIFDFYTFEGAVALSEFLKTWQGGELVVNIADMPIKCPVAPLEFAMLADSFFVKHGIRDKVNISYATPLSGAFTKPRAAKVLGSLLTKKNINIIPDFYIEKVDIEKKRLVSYDEREIPFDCLVTIPVHKGDGMIGRSGLGDEMDFAKAHKHNLQSDFFPNIFVIGDAGNFPTSKAGSVVHFQAEVLTENLMCAINRRPFTASFDGHANCYIETGFGKGAMIDFNYDTEPLSGSYPFPWIGPFRLLKESKFNHYGKLLFRWIYWHILLKGRWMPIGSKMTMTGKKM